MSTSKPSSSSAAPPRMLTWLWVTLALMALAHAAMHLDAGGLYAVSLYKCHLMSLGGWGGYWLDRALFPYGRPHAYLIEDEQPLPDHELQPGEEGILATWASPNDYPLAMLRRAIVVAACLICVGLGA